MDQGFSLTEVLVSLVLMTTTSLALLKQQWQVSQLFNEIHLRANALSQLDNAVERLYGGDDTITTIAPFKLHYIHSSHEQLTTQLGRHQDSQSFHAINVQITWLPKASSSKGCCVMERQVVIDG